ncbi:hypothetical protein BDF20DRAFT_814367 [Mycotypha africana]|uniref:uncharacterized protein n=1 Tax=Mycotypha africana TaxID=64632 RepID=UPI002300C10F|nr:uncharacterized protein BDF20DRAFT_814367 [Mycotypha africana]KAI8987577.1 hypothetical protein BDF20DRAFT_814367 [Mycotypha africana]
MPTATTFDLFEEITVEEQQELDNRKKQFNVDIEKQIAALPADPKQRSMSENRFIFNHVREEKFARPGQHRQLLSRQECQHVLDVCRAQKADSHQWTTDRHSAFPTTDIPVRHDDQLRHLEDLVKTRLFDELADHYGFKASDLAFRDIFLVKYSACAQRGLKLHTDGCLFSITLLISHEDDFEGGGTYFKNMDDIVYLKQGDCAYHDAHVLHSGVDITKGERYILVGFIDTVDTVSKDEKMNKQTLRR